MPKVPKAWWLGEPSCSHFPSFILRKASIRKFTILLWQMSDHLFLTSLCRSSIIPFGAVGFRSSSAARSASSQNSPAALGSVVAKFFMLERAAHLIPLRHLTDARFVGRLLWNIHSSANVPDDLSLLASGIQGCSAADMPEVPQA